MFEQTELGESRNPLADWILRGGIALVFFLFGTEKFTSDPESPWVKLFLQIGAGEWFRYFTGAVEVLGGLLVLIPWTATIGLALLACTMLSAATILVFVVGRPADCVFSLALFLVLSALLWRRRGSAGRRKNADQPGSAAR